MANRNLTGIVQIKRGGEQELDSSSYIPKDGELIYNKDENNIKVGDGSSKISALNYIGGNNSLFINGGGLSCIPSDVMRQIQDNMTDRTIDSSTPIEINGRGIFFGLVNPWSQYDTTLSIDGNLTISMEGSFSASHNYAILCKEFTTPYSDMIKNIIDGINYRVLGMSENSPIDADTALILPCPIIFTTGFSISTEATRTIGFGKNIYYYLFDE